MSTDATQAFLRDVQKAGWAIEEVTDDTCTVKCPAHGCAMRARLKQGGAIPRREGQGQTWDQSVTSFDEVRETLRQRRQELGLTIPEVEEVAGIAGDHLAKFERDNFDKIPNTQLFFEWANALGMQVILRYGDLPPVTLRWIADTRDRAEARQRRFQIERERQQDARREGRTA